jgi:hypothetical protein
LIERNICDRASGAGIVTEDASETGNVFRRNFVVRIVGGSGARAEDNDPGDKSKLGRAGIGFWFNGGGGNSFEDNVAAVVAECTYCYGFKFDNLFLQPLSVPVSQGADPHTGGGKIVDPYNIGLTAFIRNEAYAVPNGLTIWWFCTRLEDPRDTCSSLVKDFYVWHHHRWGYFGYQTNQMIIDGFIHRGIIDSTHTPSAAALYFGDYMTRKLTIRNANIQGTRTAIHTPSHMDVRGASGPGVGVFTIENSFLSAKTNILVQPPFSTNGSSNLAPQTTIVRNVYFEHPANMQGVNIAVAGVGSTQNLDLRNDVRVLNAPFGGGISNLYLFPSYQNASMCDGEIGDCQHDLTANFSPIPITDMRVYPLLSTTTSSGMLPPLSPSGLTVQ